MTFAQSFGFAGPGGAYTDASGAAQVAPPNTPRFDHDGAGNPRGLLVQGEPEAGAPDIVTMLPGVVGNTGCTILHSYQRPSGAIVYRAYWSRQPSSTVNALLNAKGWHRSIIVVPRALTVADGAVTFRGQAYRIASFLAMDQALSHVLGDALGSRIVGVE